MAYTNTSKPKNRYVQLPDVSGIAIDTNYWRDLKTFDVKSRANMIKTLWTILDCAAPLVTKTPNIREKYSSGRGNTDLKEVDQRYGKDEDERLYDFVMTEVRTKLGFGRWLAGIMSAPINAAPLYEWLTPSEEADERLNTEVPLVGYVASKNKKGKDSSSYLNNVKKFVEANPTLIADLIATAETARTEGFLSTVNQKTAAVEQLMAKIETAAKSAEYKALTADRSFCSCLWRALITNMMYIWTSYVVGYSEDDPTSLFSTSSTVYDMLEVIHDDDKLKKLFMDYYKYRIVTDSISADKSAFPEATTASQVERIRMFAKISIYGYTAALNADVSEAVVEQFFQLKNDLRPIAIIPPSKLPESFESITKVIKGLWVGAKIRDSMGYPISPIGTDTITIDIVKTAASVAAGLENAKTSEVTAIWNDFYDLFFEDTAVEFSPSYVPLAGLQGKRKSFYYFVFDSPYTKNSAFVRVNYRVDSLTGKLNVVQFGRKNESGQIDPSKAYDVRSVNRNLGIHYNTEGERLLAALQYPAIYKDDTGTSHELCYWGECYLDRALLELWQDTFYRCDVQVDEKDPYIFHLHPHARYYVMVPPADIETDFDLLLKGSKHEISGRKMILRPGTTALKSKGAFELYDPMMLLLSLNEEEKNGGNPESIFSRRIQTPTAGSRFFESEYFMYEPDFFTMSRIVRFGSFNVVKYAGTRLIACRRRWGILPLWTSTDNLAFENRFKVRFEAPRFVTLKVPYARKSLGTHRILDHQDGKPFYPLNGVVANETAAAYYVGGMKIPKFRITDKQYFGSASNDFYEAEVTLDLLNVGFNGSYVKVLKLDESRVLIDLSSMFGLESIESEDKAYYVWASPEGTSKGDFLSYLRPTNNVVVDMMQAASAFYFTLMCKLYHPDQFAENTDLLSKYLESLRDMAASFVREFGGTILSDKVAGERVDSLLFASTVKADFTSGLTLGQLKATLEELAKVDEAITEDDDLLDVLNLIGKVLGYPAVKEAALKENTLIDIDHRLLYVDWSKFFGELHRTTSREALPLFRMEDGIITDVSLPAELLALSSEKGALATDRFDLKGSLMWALNQYFGYALADKIGSL